MPARLEPVSSPALQFNKILDPANVKRIVEEADGYQPHLIAPEMGYRRLLQECLVSVPSFWELQACCDHEQCRPVPCWPFAATSPGLRASTPMVRHPSVGLNATGQ